MKELNLPDTPNVVTHWLGRLTDLQLIINKGKTKGTEYLVNPEFLKKVNFKGKTNLKRIENHRLEELIYQDVKIYGPTAIGDIHLRIGKELSLHIVRKAIYKMVAQEKLISTGVRAGTKYSLDQKG